MTMALEDVYVTATRTSIRVRGPRGGETLKANSAPWETPGGRETVKV